MPGRSARARGRHAGPWANILIPTFDYNRQRSTFFRSDTTSAGDSDGLAARLYGHTSPPANKGRKAIRLLEAVHASSTAPVNYFDATAKVTIHGQPNYLWDGGVAGYNNPVMAAVTEALANGVAAADMRVLSIGTGAKVLPVLKTREAEVPGGLATRPVGNSGFISDIMKVAFSILGAPPDAASYEAFVALNPGFAHQNFQNHNFVRANASLQPQWNGQHWQIPVGFTASEVERLLALSLDAITKEDVVLVQRLGAAWLADALSNQAIRTSATLDCLVGQNTFSAVERLFHQVFP